MKMPKPIRFVASGIGGVLITPLVLVAAIFILPLCALMKAYEDFK